MDGIRTAERHAIKRNVLEVIGEQFRGLEDIGVSLERARSRAPGGAVVMRHVTDPQELRPHAARNASLGTPTDSDLNPPLRPKSNGNRLLLLLVRRTLTKFTFQTFLMALLWLIN